MESLFLDADRLGKPTLLWLACLVNVAMLLMLGRGVLRMAQNPVWKLVPRGNSGLEVAFDGWIWRGWSRC